MQKVRLDSDCETLLIKCGPQHQACKVGMGRNQTKVIVDSEKIEKLIQNNGSAGGAKGGLVRKNGRQNRVRKKVRRRWL